MGKICPICKVNTVSVRNGKKRPYCRECTNKWNREKYHEKAHHSVKKPDEICVVCKRRKAQNGRTTCWSCAALKTKRQVDAWSKLIWKMEEASKYAFINCEFPPDLNKEMMFRLEKALSDIKQIITLISEEVTNE